MPNRVMFKIALPSIGLGAFLLGLGIFAAYNVHQQQKASSGLVSREVHGMLAIQDLHVSMREIRYQLNLFLRTSDPSHLRLAASLDEATNRSLKEATGYARTEREQELIATVERGYLGFFAKFRQISDKLLPQDDKPQAKLLLSSEHAALITHLSDEVLTKEVLDPLHECLEVNKLVVERTDAASQATAQHLKIGFILLGICGGAAGLIMGTGIARTIGRSIVQLNVSVRSVAGRLSNVTGPVTFSHTGDLGGIESGLRTIEQDIGAVVERLQQRETELLRSEQLARVGQLAAGLAHELRNPLMPMKMLVQAAIERGDEAGLKGRSLLVLSEEIARLEQSIQAFLDFARPPVLEKSPCDVREVVQATLDLVKGRARQQEVELRTSLPDVPAIVSMDRGQIRQLLLNLALNALDELPSGGVIEIAVSPARAPPERNGTPSDALATTQSSNEMTLHDAMRMLTDGRPPQPPDWLAIRLLDNGPGIPPGLLTTLFEPFVTTKETGTGLGLSICQHVAAAHGGTLSAQNHELGGAEFTLLLPSVS